MSDFITLLRTRGNILATKRWTEDGVVGSEAPANFDVTVRPVDNIHELSAVLREIEAEPQVYAVRGKWDGISSRRNLQTYAEVPHRWLLIDVDKFEPILCDPVLEPAESVAEYVQTVLPPEFRSVSYHWQLSSSAGKPGNEAVLKAHIWWWLEQEHGKTELEHWGRSLGNVFDITVFRTIQPHYTAAPIVDEGVFCPVVTRSGFVQGARDAVDLQLNPDWKAEGAVSDRRLKDPSEKTGLIGAFCRAYPPPRVVDELIPEVLEWESEDSDVRITWLMGGGNRGGVCVTDDGQHFYNSHATDPFVGRACNSWDMVRVHKFGDMDANATDFELDSPSTTPSFLAMREFARSLPDVQAELLESVVSELPGPAPRADEEPPEPGNSETPADLAEVPAKPAPAAAAPFEDKATQLARMLTAIERSPNTHDLEHRLAPLLRAMDLSDGDRAQCASAIQAAFKKLSKGAALPIATVREWLRPPPGSQSFVHYTEEGRLLGTIENMEQVLRNLKATVRYNTMSKEDEIIFEGQSFTVDNRANVGLALVQSECNRLDMKIQSGAIRSFINRLAERNQYNPPLEWILSKPWDGQDHLSRWYGTVKTPDRAIKEMLMFRWALQCVQILYNTGTEMGRAVLTFSGAQYAGKTRWLKSLAPEGMVLAGHVLDVHDKDSIKKAISYWITEFGELDGTLRKSDLAVLKAFISRTDDELRLPYAAAASKFPRRSCFGATVNEVEFLKDPTGNTRYWVLQADAIDADHTVDMQQVWAQVHHLWLNDGKGRLPHWLSVSELAVLNKNNDDFTEVDPLEDLARTKLAWGEPDAEQIWSTSTQIAELIGLRAAGRSDVIRLGSVIRRLNGNKHRRDRTGARLLLVPVANALG